MMNECRRKNFWFLGVTAASALCLGLLLNQFREKPLPLVYQSKEQRLVLAARHIHSNAPDIRLEVKPEQLPEMLTLEQMRIVVEKKQAVVLDARPEIFYRLGHIPNAISLPREDFTAAYLRRRKELESNQRQPLVIYCASASCEDSLLLRMKLIQLGYGNVAVFKGGWNAWTGAGLPEEKP